MILPKKLSDTTVIELKFNRQKVKNTDIMSKSQFYILLHNNI